MKMIQEFLDFAAKAPTAYQAVALWRRQLEEAGFEELRETEAWTIRPGGKYFARV